MIGVPAAVLLAVVVVVLTGGKSETTDNAYVQAARTPVSASVSGRVIEVDVADNQHVRKGQVLFRLDPADRAVAVAQAEAALATARFDAERAQAIYGQRRSDLAAAQDTAAYAEREAARQQALAAAGVSTRAQADEAVHAATLARRQITAANQQRASALADIGGRADLPIDQQPKVLQAKADLDRARLDLGYTTVVAPADGVATKVNQLQPGARVTASQPLFWLISGRPWIEANFKESQLAHMRVGQPATVRIDAYDRKLKGRVASFSPGTGSSFALLPPENATGNWVKVVQRLPVQIVLDDAAQSLSSGLSAVVTVDIRARGAASSRP